MREHAILAPSSAHRWGRCAWSAIAQEKLAVPSEASDQADQGTCAHALLEHLVTGGSVETFNPPNHLRSHYSDSMRDDIAKVHTFLVQKFEGVTIHPEKKLSIKELFHEDSHCTADIVVPDYDTHTLYVYDLKYGLTEVQAHDNPQLAMYAANALQFYDPRGVFFKTVTVGIMQPRLHEEPHEWSLSVEELATFIAPYQKQGLTILSEVKKSTWKTLPPPVPSEGGCKYCKVIAYCPAKLWDVLEFRKNVKKTSAIPVTDLTDLYILAKDIKDWVEAVTTLVTDTLKSGEAVPRLSLKRLRGGAQTWGDEAAALQYLQFALSPQQLEKVTNLKLSSPQTVTKLTNIDISSFVKYGKDVYTVEVAESEAIQGISIEVQPNEDKINGN